MTGPVFYTNKLNVKNLRSMASCDELSFSESPLLRLPTDLWLLIWAYTKGAPIRFVCQRWRNKWAYKQIHCEDIPTVELMQWYVSKGFTPGMFTFANAAKYGHLEVLKWLHPTTPCRDKNFVACSNAAKYGRLEALKWLREHEYPWHESTYIGAACAGHMEVVKWMYANGCPWSEWTCAHAADGGHLELLKWLRANVCPWNAYTCAYAASNGHIEVIRWARANGCPWDANACAFAVGYGQFETLKWLRCPDGKPEEACPWDDYTYKNAVESGRLDVIEWMRHNGGAHLIKKIPERVQNYN